MLLSTHYSSYDKTMISIKYGDRFAIDGNDDIVLYDDDNNNKCVTIQVAQQQINVLIAGCHTTNSINGFVDHAKHKKDNTLLLLKTSNRGDYTLPLYHPLLYFYMDGEYKTQTKTHPLQPPCYLYSQDTQNY